jgi:3,4-dihydroxy 2-butanone 4-phosphate synthase/GTP cyclohydrolase II
VTVTPGTPTALDRAVAALARGELILVTDDATREDEADLIGAAELISEQQMAFMIRHTTGLICVPMPASRAEALELPQMVPDNTDTHGTAFTITVDHVSTGTGVSAKDRAQTVRALADGATAPGDLRRPGHVFALRARPGGVLERDGHTEAAVDLTAMAGLSGVAVIGEVVDEDGSMRRGASLRAFAAEHGIPILSIRELVQHRRAADAVPVAAATCDLPTEFGLFRAVAYRSRDGLTEYLALVMGDVAAAGAADDGVLVRVHSECLTGEALGSLRCDCGDQLTQALSAVAAEGCGAVVYLRGHEGRGIGLVNKVRAYALQDTGMDTVDANTSQGLPADSRDYAAAAQILTDLGARRVRLITNNPEKSRALVQGGIHVVASVRHPAHATPHNLRYLLTKQDRMGHRFSASIATP